MSCSSITNEYDGVHHDYTRKRGLAWEQVFLPESAPAEWHDRSILWNAVEEAEKSKDSRLAREFVVALPVELNREQQIHLLTDFIRKQFVADGMCADATIHAADDHNPHAHILLTVRPLDTNGKWQYKTEKEYLCVRNGEERGFTASEFLHAQDEGWEKQYPYKIGKKKVYMPSSQGEAQGLQRASKYPKSTTYGRQNPIAERWNSEEQLVLWRSAWADAVNLYMEQAGYDERIDHRSHADCGLEEQPTVHEGIAARIMEKKGFLSDRCEMNRQIRADNSLLHQLKEEVKHLLSVVATNIPVILENLRDQILLIQYQLLFNAKRLVSLGERIGSISKVYKEYSHIQSQLKENNKQRKALLAEKSACGSLQFVKRAQIDARLSGVMEDMEELKSQKNQFLLRTGCDEQEVAQLDQHLKTLSSSKDRLEKQQSELSAKKIQTVDEYWEINDSILAEESSVIETKRKRLRPEHRKSLLRRLQETYGKEYRYALVCDAEKTVCKELKEEESTVSVASVLNVLRTSEITAENVSKHSERKNSPLPNR